MGNYKIVINKIIKSKILKNTCTYHYLKQVCHFKLKKDFPDIDFEKSFMVSDSDEDTKFERALGMITVYLGQEEINDHLIDLQFKNLLEFCKIIMRKTP